MQATLPTSSPGGSRQATEVIGSAAAAALLLRQYFSDLQHTIFPSFFANNISAGDRIGLMALSMHSTNTCTVVITAAAHISRLHLSKW